MSSSGGEQTVAAGSGPGLGQERCAWHYSLTGGDWTLHLLVARGQASVAIDVTVVSVERDLVFNFLDQISSGNFRRG